MKKKVAVLLVLLLSLHQLLFCSDWGEDTKSGSKSSFGGSPTLKNISISYVFSHGGKLKTDYGNGKWETKLKKYKGWSFLYRMRKPEKLYYLSPYFGFSNFTKKVSKDSWEYYADKDFKHFIRTISAGANYGINISKLSNMSLSLPEEFNPYAEIGGGWAFVSQGTGKGFMQLSNKAIVDDYYYGSYSYNIPSVWHWFRFGLNAGIGTEYTINEKMTFDLYISYHLNFLDFAIISGTSKNMEWDEETNFFNHFISWGAGLEKITDQYLRIGLGLTF